MKPPINILPAGRHDNVHQRSGNGVIGAYWTEHFRWFVPALAFLMLSYGVGRVLQPLFSVLASAAILAVVFYPVYVRLSAHISNRTAAAALTTAFVCFLVAVPLFLGAWYLLEECIRAYPMFREWIESPARNYLQQADLRRLLLDNAREIGTGSGQVLRSTAANAAALALDSIAFVSCLFLFLREGPPMIDMVRRILPFDSDAKTRVIARSQDVIVATVEGIFLTAVLQGILASVGFAIFGVSFPIILGTLCMISSPIPFVGPTVVWLPIVVRMAITNGIGRAIAMAIWFLLTVGTFDHIVRPFLISSRSRLSVPVVVIGAIGGIQSLGPIGTFLGPVLLAIVIAILDAPPRQKEHHPA